MIKIHRYMQLQVQACLVDSMILRKNKIEVVLLILNPNMNQIALIFSKMNLKWETKVKDSRDGNKN
jgi:hypothetical protein